MMDLVRKLEALAVQLDREGNRAVEKPYQPLCRTDAPTLRQAAHTICKLRAQVAQLTNTIEANRPRKVG